MAREAGAAVLVALAGHHRQEIIPLRRDRLTFGMIIGIPVLQLLLFGFAINTDPKHLPTAVLVQDDSIYARRLVAAMQTSGYFAVERTAASEAEVEELLAHGKAQFVLTIPADFSRRLIRGEAPQLLLEADAADPTAVGNAVNA